MESLESRLCLAAPSLYPGTPLALPGGNWATTPFVGSPIFADVNNDGRDELITPVAGGRINVYTTNSGTNAVQLLESFSTGSNTNIKSTPIVVTLPNGHKAIFAGLGRNESSEGSAEDGRVFGWDAQTGALLPGWPKDTGTSFVNRTASGVYRTGVVGPLTSGDLDGDGVPEIVVTSFSNFVTAYHLDGSILWRYAANDTVESGAVVADLDRDGRPEVIFGSDSSASAYFPNGGYVNILANDGTPKFRYHVPEVIWSSPVVADLNNDGYLEIIVGTGLNFSELQPLSSTFSAADRAAAQAAANRVYAFDFQGHLLPGWPYHTTSNDSLHRSTYSSPAVADINGDGIPEVIAEDEGGFLHVIEPNGQPLAGWAGGKVIAPQGTGAQAGNYASPIVADINGDGHPDIIAGAGPYLEAFNASGNIIADLAPFSSPGAHLNAAAVGQFDGSGGLELAMVSNQFGGAGQPNFLTVYHLDPSNVAPPWPMHRQTASGFAAELSPQVVRGLVGQAYTQLLGRPATSGELAYQSGLILSGVNSPARFVQAVAHSNEARGHAVDVLYQRYLGRSPTPQERALDAWRLLYVQQRKIEQELLDSPEFNNRAGGSLSQKVTLAIKALLVRDPQPGEVQAWTHAIQTNFYSYDQFVQILQNLDLGLLVDLVQAYNVSPNFSFTPETVAAVAFDLHHGRLETDVAADYLISAGNYATTRPLPSWVRTLYRDELNREASPGEVAYWVRQLDTGAISINGLVQAIVKSDEGRTQFVREEFIALLGRDPGVGGASGLKNYNQREDLIAQIVSSTEYFQRNGGTVTGLVQAIFRDIADIVLPANNPGIQSWVQKIQSGTPASGLAYALMFPTDGNTAYRSKVVVADLYRYIPDESLGALRTGPFDPSAPGQPLNPNPAYVSYFVGLLNGGMRTDDLAALMLSTGQYMAKASYYKGYYQGIGLRA